MGGVEAEDSIDNGKCDLFECTDGGGDWQWCELDGGKISNN